MAEARTTGGCPGPSGCGPSCGGPVGRRSRGQAGWRRCAAPRRRGAAVARPRGGAAPGPGPGPAGRRQRWRRSRRTWPGARGSPAGATTGGSGAGPACAGGTCCRRTSPGSRSRGRWLATGVSTRATTRVRVRELETGNVVLEQDLGFRAAAATFAGDQLLVTGYLGAVRRRGRRASSPSASRAASVRTLVASGPFPARLGAGPSKGDFHVSASGALAAVNTCGARGMRQRRDRRRDAHGADPAQRGAGVPARGDRRGPRAHGRGRRLDQGHRRPHGPRGLHDPRRRP